jgi:phosphoribosylanthranilate isomerase
MSTQVKICGIKETETLALLTELSVDYVGFVFADSRRRITSEEAGRMLGMVPKHPAAVGVFVNPAMEELDRVLAQVPLSVIQLHGQETPDFCQEVRKRFGIRLWKAIPVAEEGPLSLNLDSYVPFVEAFLFDTHDPKQAGGTGRRFSWEQIPALRERSGDAKAIIAGGITIGNVAELVSTYQPAMIDVSSGVESDGRKDPEKIKQLIKRVRYHDQFGIHTSNRS